MDDDKVDLYFLVTHNNGDLLFKLDYRSYPSGLSDEEKALFGTRAKQIFIPRLTGSVNAPAYVRTANRAMMGYQNGDKYIDNGKPYLHVQYIRIGKNRS